MGAYVITLDHMHAYGLLLMQVKWVDVKTREN